jgi:hypothetical protein
MRNGPLTIMGLGALLALPPAATPVAAQSVSIGVGVRLGDVRVGGIYQSRRHYRVPRTHFCEADGPYLYCWEPSYRRAAYPVVYVYGSPMVVVEGHYRGHRHDRGYWKRLERERRRAYERAGRAYWRWHDARGHDDRDHRRDRVNVRVVWRDD